MIYKLTFTLIFIFFCFKAKPNEIIKDINGNYYLIKKDGSFEKLPKPKPGNKYVIKKKKIKKERKKIFKRVEKKSRVRTNQGFR
tara:strand:- start:76 stop:327 length:252 start_codon:yes stop_codon:yes gene_type:complete